MSFGMEALNNPSYGEDADIEIEISEEIEDEILERVEEVEETADAVEDVEDIVEESDKGEDAIEIIETVEEVVAEEGYTRGVARLCEKMGIAQAAGCVGYEELSAVGKNEDQAKLILAGCESMFQKWWENIKKFFKALANRIERLVTWVIEKFASYERALKNAAVQLKDLGELDDDKVSKAKFKGIKPTDGMSLTVAVEDASKSPEASNAVAKTVANAANLAKLYSESDSTNAGDFLKEQVADAVVTAEDVKEFNRKLKLEDVDLKDAPVNELLAAIPGIVAGLSGAAEFKKFPKAVKDLERGALSAAKVLERGDSSDEAKKKRKEVELYRELGTNIGRRSTVTTKLISTIARHILNATRAWRSCKK